MSNGVIYLITHTSAQTFISSMRVGERRVFANLLRED